MTRSAVLCFILGLVLCVPARAQEMRPDSLTEDARRLEQLLTRMLERELPLSRVSEGWRSPIAGMDRCGNFLVGIDLDEDGVVDMVGFTVRLVADSIVGALTVEGWRLAVVEDDSIAVPTIRLLESEKELPPFVLRLSPMERQEAWCLHELNMERPERSRPKGAELPNVVYRY